MGGGKKKGRKSTKRVPKKIAQALTQGPAVQQVQAPPAGPAADQIGGEVSLGQPDQQPTG